MNFFTQIKVAKFSVNQTQSVNKRDFLSRHKVAQTIISICPKPTQERTIAKRFSQDILPPA